MTFKTFDMLDIDEMYGTVLLSIHVVNSLSPSPFFFSSSSMSEQRPERHLSLSGLPTDQGLEDEIINLSSNRITDDFTNNQPMSTASSSFKYQRRNTKKSFRFTTLVAAFCTSVKCVSLV